MKTGIGKERAKYLMQTAEQAVDLVPIVGGAVGADETKEAYDRGAYTEAVINGVTTALGEIPGGGDIAAGVTKAIFGGIGAKLRSLHGNRTMGDSPGLRRAVDMENDLDERRIAGGPFGDLSSEEIEEEKTRIWRETGWFRGADYKWRFEIPDDTSYVNEKVFDDVDVLEGNRSLPLHQVIKHDELFDAYPDLKDVRVVMDKRVRKEGGFYMIKEDTIVLSPETVDNKSTLLHEIQHAIQEREGFARGSNPSIENVKPGHPSWEIYETNLNKALTPISEEEWGRARGIDFIHLGFDTEILGRSYEEYLKNLDDIIQEEDAAPLLTGEGYTSQLKRLQNFHKRGAAWEHYARSAGENESGAVEKRIFMDSQERYWNKPPWRSTRYDEKDQIVDLPRNKYGWKAQTDKALKKSSKIKSLPNDVAMSVPPEGTKNVFIIHGGSDFEDVDLSKSGTGEPGNIRPLGRGLYSFVVDPDNPEEAKRAIDWARHYSKKYGRGKKKLHVFSVPTSAETRFNGPRVGNFAQNYTPEEQAWHDALREADKLPVGPERRKAFDEAEKLRAAAKANPSKVQMKGERLPIDLTELSILDKEILSKIGKFDVDASDEEILKTISLILQTEKNK